MDIDGYILQSPDSERWAEELQFDRWRRMSLQEKVEAVRQLARDCERLQVVGLRLLLPDASEHDIRLEAAAIRVGAELVRKITGYASRLASTPASPTSSIAR